MHRPENIMPLYYRRWVGHKKIKKSLNHHWERDHEIMQMRCVYANTMYKSIQLPKNNYLPFNTNRGFKLRPNHIFFTYKLCKIVMTEEPSRIHCNLHGNWMYQSQCVCVHTSLPRYCLCWGSVCGKSNIPSSCSSTMSTGICRSALIFACRKKNSYLLTYNDQKMCCHYATLKIYEIYCVKYWMVLLYFIATNVVYYYFSIKKNQFWHLIFFLSYDFFMPYSNVTKDTNIF